MNINDIRPTDIITAVTDDCVSTHGEIKTRYATYNIGVEMIDEPECTEIHMTGRADEIVRWANDWDLDLDFIFVVDPATDTASDELGECIDWA